MGMLADNIRRMIEVKDKEIVLLRSAIEKSNVALAEAVNTKEERDRLRIQNDRYRQALERLNRCTCRRGNGLVEDGHVEDCDKLVVKAALQGDPARARDGRCDCGASIAFPAHQPACPLHMEYRAG